MRGMGTRRATIYCDDIGQKRSAEFVLVQDWMKRWEGKVRVADYSSGGWEHIWDVEGPPEAINELPPELLCSSEWVD
jgi:hypothetical protein